tara:strand:+ start:45271 stop:45684 length:414 start_codon:yes stop_codon:yes gene_type:complete
VKLFSYKDKLSKEKKYLVAGDLEEANEILKTEDISIDKRSPIKEEVFPEGQLRIFNPNEIIYTFLNGELFSSWYNLSNMNSPEDMTWERSIGSLVYEIEQLKDRELNNRLNKISNSLDYFKGEINPDTMKKIKELLK